MSHEDVTPRELMNDAARIGDWIRETRRLEIERDLLVEQFYKEAGPLGTNDDRSMRTIEIHDRVRAERPELIERLSFLVAEVDAALARGRLVEMAALAERYAL